MVRAPMARARSDHGERADRRRRIDRRIRRNRREWMHARGRWLIRRQHLRGASERQIRRLAANDGARRRRRRRVAVHDHGAGPGRRQLGGVFGIGEKREIARTRVFDLRHAANLDGGIALDRAFQTTSQLAERHEVENITASLLPLCPSLRPGGTAAPSVRRNGPYAACGGGARRPKSPGGGWPHRAKTRGATRRAPGWA